MFLLFGPLFLVLAIPIDSFVFFYNLFTIPVSDQEEDEELITTEELDTFKLTCTQTLKWERFHNPAASKNKTRVNFVKLNKSLQQRFYI